MNWWWPCENSFPGCISQKLRAWFCVKKLGKSQACHCLHKNNCGVGLIRTLLGRPWHHHHRLHMSRKNNENAMKKHPFVNLQWNTIGIPLATQPLSRLHSHFRQKVHNQQRRLNSAVATKGRLQGLDLGTHRLHFLTELLAQSSLCHLCHCATCATKTDKTLIQRPQRCGTR